MVTRGKQPRQDGMSARLLALHAETNTPQPYEVTDTLVVQPPTRTRVKAMNAAEMKIYVGNQLLSQALKRVVTPRPVLGEVVTPDDATEDAVKALVEQAAAKHEQAVAEWERSEISQEDIDAIGAQVSAAETEYERAFFGDVYDELIEFFEDKPELWAKFVPDIKKEFGPKEPDDGVCPSCGKVVDEEAAGKDPESST